MIDAIIDTITQGVDAFITAIFVSFIMSMMAIQMQLATAISSQQQRAMEMQSYREFNAYDRTHVYSSDVISTILKYRGYPQVRVTLDSSHNYLWTTDSSPVAYTTTDLSNLITPDKLYDADIEYEDGSRTAVKALTFRACYGSCGR